MSPRRTWVIRLVAYTTLLYGSFAHNVLCIPETVESCTGAFRTRYVGYDSALVMNRIDHGESGKSGLICWDARARAEDRYQSQYGIQGEVLAAVAAGVGATGPAFAAAAGAACAGITALSWAVFFTSLGRRIGPTAADLAAVLTASVPVLLPFAPSLYWVPFLMSAPFLAVWVLYPHTAGRPGRLVALVGLTSGLVGLKCLCGYEYVTTVILAPVSALTYHAAAGGERLRGRVGKATALWGAGVVGFGLAVAVHAHQLERETGRSGLEVIRERAAHRVGTNDARDESNYLLLAPDPAVLPEPARYRVRCLLNYFWLPAVASPQTWAGGRFTLSLGAVTLAAAGLGAVGLAARRRLTPAVVALVPAGAIGFAGALSWQVLATNHMTAHVHLNLIVFCLPFLPFAFAGLGCAGQWAARRVGVGPGAAAGLVGGAVVAAVGVNAVVLDRRAEEVAVADRLAAEQVGAVLRGERTVGPPAAWMLGTARPLPAEPWGSLFGPESDPRLIPPGPGSGHVCWFVNVVVQADRRSDAGPGVRVVAVRDGVVIPARTEWARQTVIERAVGGQASWTGVSAVVVGDGPAPRLFAVSGPGGATVTELVIPGR